MEMQKKRKKEEEIEEIETKEKKPSEERESIIISKGDDFIPPFELLETEKQKKVKEKEKETGGRNLPTLFRSGALTSFLNQLEEEKKSVGDGETEIQRPPNHPTLLSSSHSVSQLFTTSSSLTSSYFTTSTTTNSSTSLSRIGSQFVKPSASTPAQKSGNTILVNPCQKGNRILKYIKNVPMEFAAISPDYILGSNTCALYLSLKYYLLYPEYIYKRAGKLQNSQFNCKVLLVIADVDNSTKPIQELIKFSLIDGWSLILTWSNQEAARYLETYKMYETKSPDLIKERAKEDFLGKLQDTLTTIRGVNKTDVKNLMENFGSLKQVMNASMEELSLCPGLGEKKVKRLYNTVHRPFKSK